MNLEELIKEIALELDVKPGRVRKIAKSIIDKIDQKLGVDEIIITPSLVFRPQIGKVDTSRIGFIKRRPAKEDTE